MSLDMNQLRAAFKTEKKESTHFENNYYPFWNVQMGEQATVRFLPDKNQDNPMGFVVEKLMHTLEINGEKKSIPCLKMYNDDCPICKVSADFYKNNDKVNGKKYWRKNQHIAQAFVVSDPLPPDKDTDETHAGKVRYLALGYQIFNIIKESFESGELDEIPYSYKNGTDFIIKKSPQGEYTTYALGSKFVRKSTDLDDDTIALVQSQMIDLSTLLPKNPGVEKVQQWLEAALTGGSVDASGTEVDSDDAGVPVVKTSPTTKVEAVKEEALNDEAEAILAQIRNRRNAQKS